MKKKTMRKLVASFAIAALFVGGAVAQVESTGNYVAIDGDTDGTIATAGGIDTVANSTATWTSTSRYYADPDSYFHPNYNAGGGWALSASSTTFDWTSTPVLAGFTETDNYVDATFPTGSAGNTYRLTVTETAPPAWGGCSSDTNMWVRVIDVPSVAYTPDAVGTIIGGDTTLCEGDAVLAGIVQAAFTHYMNSSANASIQLDYTVQIYTVDADGTSNILYWPSDLSGVGSAVAVLAADSLHTSGTGQQITGIDATTYDLFKPSGGFVAHDDNGTTKRRTVYTYSIQGVNDRISRKSEYSSNTTQNLNNWTFHDATADLVTITVNPAPVTGPIYHIPNMWAN